MLRTPTLLSAILLIALLVVGGYGYYQTRTVQPAVIAELENKEKELIARQAGVEGLMIEFNENREQADLALRRWNARYKVLPTTLTSPAVVDYLNALTQNGFNTFDLSLVGRDIGAIQSKYTYRASGQAYFGALYGLLWNLENGRGLYRVSNLNVNRTTVKVDDPDREEDRDVIMSEFEFVVEAYFSGQDGISAPGLADRGAGGRAAAALAAARPLLPVHSGRPAAQPRRPGGRGEGLAGLGRRSARYV